MKTGAAGESFIARNAAILATNAIPAPHFGTFFGEVTRRRELSQLTLTETRYPPEYRVPLHRHGLPWLGFVLEGSLSEILRNKCLDFHPLTLIYRMVGEPHANRSGQTGGRCFTLEMKEGFFKSFVKDAGLSEHSGEFDGGLLPALMLRLYEEFTIMDQVSALSIEGITLELLAEAHRRSSILSGQVPPGWLKRAMELVRERFGENLLLSEIAAQAGTHPVHLSRAFRRCYGYSIGGFIRKLRIEYAYRELIATDKPIVDIALVAGFCDQPHFSRTFKRLTGMNPKEVRTSRKSLQGGVHSASLAWRNQ